MHIVQCPGGVDSYLSMLLPLLEQYKLYQILVCSYDYDYKKYINEVDKVEQLDMKQSFNLLKLIKNIRRIRSLVRYYRPDIVYCHSSIAGGIGRIACCGLHVKIVYNPHGWAFNMKK